MLCTKRPSRSLRHVLYTEIPFPSQKSLFDMQKKILSLSTSLPHIGKTLSLHTLCFGYKKTLSLAMSCFTDSYAKKNFRSHPFALYVTVSYTKRPFQVVSTVTVSYADDPFDPFIPPLGPWRQNGNNTAVTLSDTTWHDHHSA